MSLVAAAPSRSCGGPVKKVCENKALIMGAFGVLPPQHSVQPPHCNGLPRPSQPEGKKSAHMVGQPSSQLLKLAVEARRPSTPSLPTTTRPFHQPWTATLSPRHPLPPFFLPSFFFKKSFIYHFHTATKAGKDLKSTSNIVSGVNAIVSQGIIIAHS